ncbi:MAG TPA: hypothetical protein VK427_20045, partial [Kofleriaceae bacterium]|nr:hypothetical protein [Kofleriaceae bacterium]
MSRWRRYEPLVLLAIPVIWALVVCREAYMTDPDSYLHIGCARRLVSGGCIRTFPWLPYTTLADPFPNMYLGQHALLAPFASVLPPGMALRAGVLVLSSGLAASLYLVLRRHGVARPAWWVLFGLVAVPQPLIYTLYIKGAATFLILLVWFVDAVWAGRTRRTFVLAWLSVYVYVGATVLVPFAIVHVFVVRGLERRWTWSLVGATLLGLTAGMFAHPGWPAHWLHIARELRTMVEFDPRLVPGVLRGAEWVPLVGPQIASLVGPLLVAWCVVLVRRLAERCEPVPSGALSATIAMLGLLGASLISGTKMLELAAVFSILALPRVAGVLAWPRWVAPLMVALGIALCVRNVVRLADELARPGFSHPRDYEDLAAWLAPRTDPEEV